MEVLHRATLSGSSVTVEIGRHDNGWFWQVNINGSFFDGDYCDEQEAFERMKNPFRVKPISRSEPDYTGRDFSENFRRSASLAG